MAILVSRHATLAGGRAARRLAAAIAALSAAGLAVIAADVGFGRPAVAAPAPDAASAEPPRLDRSLVGRGPGAASELSRPVESVGPVQRSARNVIVVGIPGLRWSDLSRGATPALWNLFANGSAAAVSVRTPHPQTCPIDGWLTLGAGSRATASHDDGCTPIPEPAQGPAGTATVPGFAAIVAANDDFSYEPRFGLLATEATQAASCLTAVGPGAAVAAADETGQVSRYVADPAAVTTPTLTPCPITLVDAGTVPDGPPARTSFLQGADALVRRIVESAPDGATVVVAGIADRTSRPHLGALIIAGPAFSGGWLTADSTRHPGLVQLTDLTPTVLSLAAIPVPDELVGAVMTTTGGRPADSDTAWQRLAQQDVAAQTIRDYAGIFFVLLEVGQILLYIMVAVLLSRRRGRVGIQMETRRLGQVLYAGALFVASAPAASFLANLVPWWRAVHPAPILAAAVLVGAAALAAAALLGPWRRWHPLGPAGFVAAVTTLALAADVMVGGSRLQLSSLYGLSTLIAGRFYGFGNVAFAVFAMSAMFTALAFAAILRARTRAALGAVAGVAVLAILADGWPGWGADFGGVVAMVPGFALLGLAVANKRASVRLVTALTAVAVVAVAAIATLDWLRPADQRSHLGRFVQQVLDGEAGPVVDRKLDAMARSFTRGPEGVVIPILLVLVGYLLLHPERFPTLKRAFDRIPLLRPGLAAMLTTAVLGVVVNDSGIQVAAVCLTVATPLAVATCARFLNREPALEERAVDATVPT